MDSSTQKVIEDILKGCTGDIERHRRYLTRTCWRVEGDFAFLRRALPHPGSVLDVGAVPPMLAGLMSHAGLARPAVVDPEVDEFAAFFQRSGMEFFRGDLLSGDRIALPGQYDLVCLCEVVEHLTGDILSALETVSKWVRPEGYFYVTTPNLRSITGMVALFLRNSGLASKSRETVRKQYERARGPCGYYGHIREYTTKEVVDLIESLGFRHVESCFQVHPRAETAGARLIQLVEWTLPSFRLFGKHLFRKNFNPKK